MAMQFHAKQCTCNPRQNNAFPIHTDAILLMQDTAINAGRFFPITIPPHDGFSLVGTLSVAGPHLCESYTRDNTEQCQNATLNVQCRLMQSINTTYSKQVP